MVGEEEDEEEGGEEEHEEEDVGMGWRGRKQEDRGR